MAEWFKKWFQQDYELVYPHRSLEQAGREVDFLAHELGLRQTDQILDIACGGGRHLYHLRDRSLNAFGGDLSFYLLQKALHASPAMSGRLSCYDMRRLPFRNSVFTVVTSLFTSFGYFSDATQDTEVLVEVERVLQPGGQFFLDFLNAQKTIAALKPHSKRELEDGFIEERRQFNERSQRIEKEITVSQMGEFRVYKESVRAYSKTELLQMLEEVGLRPFKCYGDFEGSDYTAESDRVIVLARKEG